MCNGVNLEGRSFSTSQSTNANGKAEGYVQKKDDAFTVLVFAPCLVAIECS